MVFAFFVVFYGAVLLVIALAGHWILLQAAYFVRWCARRLARNATLATLVRLESSSARIEMQLRWFATRVVRSSLGASEQVTILPKLSDERLGTRALRWALRIIWLMLRGVVIAATKVPVMFSKWPGMVVLVFAALTAFPDAIRAGTATLVMMIDGLTWPQTSSLTLTTAIVAAVVPIAIILVKLMVNERSAARRDFRRQRNVQVLEQLRTAAPEIERLISEIDSQMHDVVRSFGVERYHAGQWYEWSQRLEENQQITHWERRSDHTECVKGCLNSYGMEVKEREHSDSVDNAVSALEIIWKKSLLAQWDQRDALARMLSRKAWRGFCALAGSFSTSGEFWKWKLPSDDEWKRRRILWQHKQLTWAEPTAADVAAGREVATNTAPHPPDQGWLEEDLYDQVWNLAELSRELSDLTDFVYRLGRPSRLDRLKQMSEG